MSKTQPTILLIGLGHLGGVLLEFLAREAWIGRIIACSRSRERGEARCNLARLGAIAQGFVPRIEYQQMDVLRPPEVAAVLERSSPDLVISSASMQTWWLPELLPTDARERLQRARFGVWLPLHLAPTLALMEAIDACSYAGPVVTAPFPDVVNCVLGKLRLAPTCGIGNIDELVAKVRWSAARHFDLPIDEIEALMVAHHALESAVFGTGVGDAPPFFLRIVVQGKKVTDARLAEALLFSASPLPNGPETAFFTTGSTVRLVRAMLADSDTLLHVPAPQGLPGGYPVLAGGGRVELAPIGGLAPQEAIDINVRSLPYDGIESIEADGTAVFNAESVEILRTELGYDCARLPPAEALDRGHELRARFRDYCGHHGIDLTKIG